MTIYGYVEDKEQHLQRQYSSCYLKATVGYKRLKLKRYWHHLLYAHFLLFLMMECQKLQKIDKNS